MEYSDIHSVFDLVHLSAAHGIKHAVISPGSRNAPLSISLHRHPEIKTFVIPDERAAAFFAMGLSQQSGVPTLLCCTSGSAPLNYAPAIAEAFYQRIPLLVVTADRPKEWIDQGDGQTIRQQNVFQNYVRHSFELIQDAAAEPDLSENRHRINKAIHLTNNPVDGPVHLNFPLREPLYRTRPYSSEEIPTIQKPELATEKEVDWASFEQKLAEKKRVLIICSLLNPNSALEKELAQWAKYSQVAVLTETTANLNHELFFPCIDRLIVTFNEADTARLNPDLVITIGHQIISKKIKAILRDQQLADHWHIDSDAHHPNTFGALSGSIYTQPEVALSRLRSALATGDFYYSTWLRNRDKIIDTAHTEFMVDYPFSDLKAVSAMLDHIPQHTNLHAGNSASVRYLQLFKKGRVERNDCNRGTSGIDGCTSTAMGAATESGRNTVLVTGDMAFLYDKNAFWHNQVPGNLKIIVLNNAGGGIFRIIDGSSVEEEVEKYFEAHHQQTAGQVAQMYGLPYFAAHNEEELEAGLKTLFSSSENKPVILEVFTPRLQNDRVLKNYFRHLSAACKTNHSQHE